MKPRYNFFKNSMYAFNGLKDVIKTERSFQIELLVLLIVVMPYILYSEFSSLEKLLLFSSYFGILIAEAINSSIERVVDLITLEKNDLAGKAKDIGSLVVLLSIFNTIIIWLYIVLI
ncbi:diacylglycerol kinase [bacterium]|jgi:diacylglycerol kinase (ATP)|nr:diacylglycerol kinase [bacterium]